MFLVVRLLFLVVRPEAPSSVLAPSSFLFVVARLLSLVVRPEAPSSVLAPSSDQNAQNIVPNLRDKMIENVLKVCGKLGEKSP